MTHTHTPSPHPQPWSRYLTGMTLWVRGLPWLYDIYSIAMTTNTPFKCMYKPLITGYFPIVDIKRSKVCHKILTPAMRFPVLITGHIGIKTIPWFITGAGTWNCRVYTSTLPCLHVDVWLGYRTALQQPRRQGRNRSETRSTMASSKNKTTGIKQRYI